MSKAYPPLGSDDEIRQLSVERATRRKCGPGLYLHVQKNGYKYFQFRMRFAGNEVSHHLGRFPEMDLAEARKLAESHRDELKSARRKLAEKAFSKRLASAGRSKLRVDGDSQGFKSVEDAADCFRRLFFREGLSEAEVAVALLFLIPVRPGDLLRARRDEIASWQIKVHEGAAQLCQWSARSEKKRRGVVETTYNRSYLLTETAVRLLSRLPPGADPKGWVFPGLAGKTPGERDSLLNMALNKCWGQYPVKVSALRGGFEASVGAAKLYHQDLISEVVAGKFRPGEQLYDLARYALAVWWSARLAHAPPGII